jgi:hypothetical protein
MKAIPSLDFIVDKPEHIKRFSTMLQKIHQQVARVINGKIGYGDGTNADNIDGVWASETFASANTDTTITHNLGRVPVGFHVVSKSVSCDIFNGVAAWTTTTITLQSSVAPATVKLFVF